MASSLCKPRTASALRVAWTARTHIVPAAAARRYGSEPDRPAPKPPTLERRRAEPRKPEPSFNSQMAGSIQARLRRESDQRVQYERWRELKDPARNWYMTFFFLSGLGIAYYLGTFWPREGDGSSTLPLSKARKPQHKTRMENMQAAWFDFIEIVGKENVSTVEHVIEQHRTSAWTTHQPPEDEKPFCVVYPASTDEVSRLLKVCHKRRVPVVAYSGGTSIEGQYVQTRKGVSIDFSRMDKVLAVHKDDLDVVVQPAVGWETLNDMLADDGLFFPPDPGRGAMIGGMIGTGCSGTNAFRYGTMREWVIGLTVVLADGTVIKTRQRPRKSSAGYDLTKLFVGSEGTLGLVTEAVLRLTVKPQATNVAVCSFPSIRHAATCAASVVGRGVPVAAMELLDDDQMRFTNAAGTTSRSWAEAPTLFFKFSGTPLGVKEQAAQVQKLARQAGALTLEVARDEKEQEELWSARRSALWSVMAAGRETDKVWTGDVAVPMSHLPVIIEKTKEDLKSSGLTAGIVGHVGDGNFHVCLLYSDAQREKAEKLMSRMAKRAIEMEGTVTGEHGVGLVKRDYLPHELGETTVDAMRQIKLALDPLCLLNCDKVLRMEKPKRGEVKEW
ncbi:D-lactate dehydrogenase, mitochondrial precursor [Ophiocordyceps camponoti-floridani]|uniref:D-lactate dehydrogenase (cytochrome) n=1 Tax=Ophiocordyceps camponoti-floridani TaxID=2030778 RepID=A0A8H4VFM5_9HYPO|nr:D-lactate dehydrogenase, mitochondrial precursor [Ophiocordyceps camponoti-floridani]